MIWEEQLLQQDTAEARLGYALALAEAGSLREAITIAQGSLVLLPNGQTSYDLHRLLAEWTQDLSHYHEAARLAPTLAAAQARLGCALARAGRVAEAVPHLQQALILDPQDAGAKTALQQARQDLGLDGAAPLTSIILLCCNAWPYTQRCLQTVFENTTAPYELILIDNGSSDETRDKLDSFARQPGPVRVVVQRLPENLGYPAGVNHGLDHAQGDGVVLLNNDTLVTPHWLEGLWRAVRHDPQVGLVGAVSNFAGGWQQVSQPEDNPDHADTIALWRRIGTSTSSVASACSSPGPPCNR
jgi:Glycosyl transferase family 2